MANRRNAFYALLIVFLVAGALTERSFFFHLSYALVALLAGSFLWSWTAVNFMRLGRYTQARRAQVGRTLEESFAVHNTSILPKLWLEVRDQSTLPGHRASHVVPAMLGRSRYRWHVETPCTVRGEFFLGPVTLISGDPFGLFLSQRKLGATSRVIVYPQTAPVTHFELPMGMLSGGEAQRQRAHYVTTNAAGVREYVTGDSFNRIHWASTARKERLMVKEFDIDPMVDIWLFVDFSLESLVEDPRLRRINGNGPAIPSNGEIPPSTEEYGVVTAASLAKHFIDLERALGFVAYTPHREIHQPERGNRQLIRILQTLAVARSTAPFSLAHMLTLETPYLTRGTTLVIVTSSLEPAWVAEAQILARKGIRPLCVLVDPQSFGAPSSADELRGLLRLARIPTIVIRHGDDLTAALAQRPL